MVGGLAGPGVRGADERGLRDRRDRLLLRGRREGVERARRAAPQPDRRARRAGRPPRVDPLRDPQGDVAPGRAAPDRAPPDVGSDPLGLRRDVRQTHPPLHRDRRVADPDHRGDRPHPAARGRRPRPAGRRLGRADRRHDRVPHRRDQHDADAASGSRSSRPRRRGRSSSSTRAERSARSPRTGSRSTASGRSSAASRSPSASGSSSARRPSSCPSRSGSASAGRCSPRSSSSRTARPSPGSGEASPSCVDAGSTSRRSSASEP